MVSRLFSRHSDSDFRLEVIRGEGKRGCNMSKKRRLLLLVGMLFLLASCSGRIQQEETERTGEISERTVETVQTACDAVFFGDSITCDGNFDQLFPELRIVNLGVYGDTILDLQRRVEQVKAADPAVVFLLVGINCLRPDNVADCLNQYRALLTDLAAACPRAKLVIQSVLPVAAEIDPEGRENQAVRAFNAGLEALAREKSLDYVNLHSRYAKDGALDPTLTRDGLHLNFNAYGPWAALVAPYMPSN